MIRMIAIMVMLVLMYSLIMKTISFAYAGGTAFKSGEVTTGWTKQCYYTYLGSTYTITIKSYEICPLTIEVK